MIEEKFYYCKVCKKPIPTSHKRCTCGRRFRGDQSFTAEQIELIKIGKLNIDSGLENSEEETEDSDQSMQCPVCGKRYARNQDMCTDCHTPLQLWIDPDQFAEEQPQIQAQEPQPQSQLRPIEQIDYENAEIIEKPTWELQVKRYMNGREFTGRSICINRTIMPLGRTYLLDNNVFSPDKNEVRGLIRRISRNNAFLIIKDGNLYIEYDSAKEHQTPNPKARIRVNGSILRDGERMQITEGDLCIFGDQGQSSLNGCVGMTLSKIKKEPLRMEAATGIAGEKSIASGVGVGNESATGLSNAGFIDPQQFIDNNNMMQLVNESLKKVEEVTLKSLKLSQATLDKQEQSIEIQNKTLNQAKDNYKEIKKVSDLSVSQFDSIESFMAAAGTLEQQDDTAHKQKSRDEYIDEYLGDYKYKKQLLDCLNDAQKQYIYFAAYIESKIDKEDQENMDYSGCFLFLGKLLENFYYQKLCPFIERFDPERWQNMSAKNEQNGENQMMLGTVLGAFIWSNKETKERGVKKGIVRKICCEYCNSDRYDNRVFYEMQDTFLKCDTAKGNRNGSAHSTIEAMLANQIKVVSYKEYIQAKKNVVNSDMIININKYYNKIFSTGNEKA